MPRDFEPSPASVLSQTQKTLARAVSCSGSATHGGQDVTMVLHPAQADSGIVFERTDLSQHNLIPALWNQVQVTPLCTQIVNAQGAEVRTIEHIMAALYAHGIDNVHITLDGPEVPLMDGASGFFMNLIAEAGPVSARATRRFLKIIRAVEVRRGEAFARLEPAATPAFDITVAYPQHKVGPQSFEFDFAEQDFAEEVAAARTFGFETDIAALRQKGLTLGCSLDNAILINAAGHIANPEGYRFENELARHKLLDAIGDLSLAGAVILGRFTGNLSGHALNNALLHALFADKSAFMEMQTADGKAPVTVGENQVLIAY